MNSRLKQAIAKLKEGRLDGLLISCAANVSYLTESISRDSYLLISKPGNIYFTDSRYVEEAGNFLKQNARLMQSNGTVFKCIAQSCLDLGLRRLGFESRYLPYAEYAKIKSYCGDKIKFIPTHSLIEGLRQIKDASEITKIRKAVAITKDTAEYIHQILKPGLKEVELVAELERFIRYHGARSSAFDIIAASGPNSSQPHHLSGERKIRNNEPVLIDFGVDYCGYKSDLTRVFFLGKIKVLVKKVYEIVLRAQAEAIKRIKPGVEIAEIDRVAREYIFRQGYAGKFQHNLGHGFGLEVHEDPQIGRNEASLLEAGMTFTVEPGIYLPGEFGIRIEDMVLITNQGCEVLSGAINQ